MKVLIADDEPIARQVLREMLEDLPGIEITGEAATGRETAEQIRQTEPDLVLLDLQMPEMDGFSVAHSLQGSQFPLIIFVTAFAEHALEAFDSGAVDYLLKPVRRSRLEEALAKARAQLAGLRKGKPTAVAPTRAEKIVGRIGQDLHLLDSADVIAFEADRDVVYILTASGRFYADHSLKQLEALLPQPPFRRVHRKTIINADHIRKLSPLSSKRWLLRMSNGMEVIVSKRMRDTVREATHW